MMRRYISIFLVSSACGLCPLNLVAQGSATVPDEQLTFTDDWFGYGPAMRANGMNFRLEWTQFYQGVVQGDSEGTWEYGGHWDALMQFDMSKLGLWDGLSVTFEGYFNYGDSLNGTDGTAFPVNSALFFPDIQISDGNALMAFYARQEFSDNVSLTVGRMNNIESIRYRPIAGGGGVDTFWNLNPAVTSSGLVPAVIHGAALSVKSDQMSYSFMLYDPVDAQLNPIFEGLFRNGYGLNAGATYRTSIADRTGFYGVSVSYANSVKPDLSDLITNPAGEAAGGINDDFELLEDQWAVALTFQQFLHQNSIDPTKGWGVFGALTRSDGNPTLLELSYMIGIGGNDFIPGRPDDAFGIAYSRFGISNAFQEEFDFLQTGNEYLVEAFYKLAATPWMSITADLQWVRPAGGSFSDSLIAGVGTTIKF